MSRIYRVYFSRHSNTYALVPALNSQQAVIKAREEGYPIQKACRTSMLPYPHSLAIQTSPFFLLHGAAAACRQMNSKLLEAINV